MIEFDISSLNHIQSSEIITATTLVGYRGDYSDYADADDSVAIYETAAHQAVTTFDENKIAVYQAFGFYRMIKELLGNDDFTVGFVSITKDERFFLSLDFIKEMLLKFGDDITVIQLVNLTVELLDNPSAAIEQRILEGDMLEKPTNYFNRTPRKLIRYIDCDCGVSEERDRSNHLHKFDEFDLIETITTDPDGQTDDFYEGAFKCICGRYTVSKSYVV